ncbi:MAG: helix-turn-helix domain-containing protein [Lachnospiraceae bacterium]|nr:helix-turn-helix domain-containing protein [Lachnospiraceae bacterium]
MWGMTQCKLTDKLDYTGERQLQRIENGDTSCSVDKLMEITQILDVTTDYLLFSSVKEMVACFRSILKTKRRKR